MNRYRQAMIDVRFQLEERLRNLNVLNNTDKIDGVKSGVDWSLKVLCDHLQEADDELPN